MPRPWSSARYVVSWSAEAEAEERWTKDEDISNVEPRVGVPDYLSIIWLASKTTIYGQSHMSSSGMRGTFYLGQGATFVAYRSRENSKGVCYVIKRPIISFGPGRDDVTILRQLYSLQLELRILTDRRFKSHGHIVRLETILWEEHPDDLGRYWPSLVMEYANLGTLSDLYETGWRPHDFDQERALCYAVGETLRFLHENGVVHGDIKPENVLMFANDPSNGGVVPKLADFGYALVDGANPSLVPLGTFPWTAPEVGEPDTATADLLYADVYSFGLLIWFVLENGRNPFELADVCRWPLDSHKAKGAIIELKRSDAVLSIALKSVPHKKAPYIDVFKLILKAEPAARDLNGALKHLASDQEAKKHVIMNTARTEPRQTIASNFKVRELRHIDPRIQPQILEGLEARTHSQRGYSDFQRAEAAMALVISCLEGMGQRQPEEAVKWLLLAASLGHPQAKSSLYRIAKALGLYESNRKQILMHLLSSAKEGIPISVEDLSEADPHQGQEVLQTLLEQRRRECIPFLDADFTQEEALNEIIKDLALEEKVSHEVLLHRAARCGDTTTIRHYLQRASDRNEDVNAINDAGQTPLLLACIAGESAAALMLLQAGADATKADQEGDTPLHWLNAFDYERMPALGSCLLEHGADIHAETKRTEVDIFYQKPLCAGTPLHRAAGWNNAEAVRFLIEHGADPLRPGILNHLGTPLWLACTFHNVDVVECILEHLSRTTDVRSIVNDNPTNQWPLLMPVLDIGYYYLNGGALGRMTRHGESYRRATESTIKALKRSGSTMLLTTLPAVSQAILLRCIDMVEALLDICPELINQPGGPHKQAPLHFAVQQDRADLVELLLSKGANPMVRRGDGLTALSTYALYRRSLEIPRILLNRGLTFELPPPGLATPFFGAIKNEAFELARFILKKVPGEARHLMINCPCHSGPNFKCTEPGLTILGYLLFDCNVNTLHTMRKLFNLVGEFGCYVDFIAYPGEQKSALQCLASFQRHMRLNPVITGLAKELLSRFNSPEEIDYANKTDGKTALWLAVRNLNYDLAAELLSRAADPAIPNSDGVSTLSLLQDQLSHVKTVEHHVGRDEHRQVEEMERLFGSHGYLVTERIPSGADGQ